MYNSRWKSAIKKNKTGNWGEMAQTAIYFSRGGEKN